jgi:hypothetical protein
MSTNQCASCGSGDVYCANGGLAAVAFGRVNGLKLCPDPMSFPTPEQYSDQMTACVCTSCGRVELYAEDKAFLDRIKSDPTWKKVNAAS